MWDPTKAPDYQPHTPPQCSVCDKPVRGAYLSSSDGVVCEVCIPVTVTRTRCGCGHWDYTTQSWPSKCASCREAS